MSGYLDICSLITELGQVNDSITLLAMLIVGLFVDKYKNNPQDRRTEVFCAILFFFFFFPVLLRYAHYFTGEEDLT